MSVDIRRSTDVSVTSAVRDLILDIRRDLPGTPWDQTYITPQTELDAQTGINVGDLDAVVADPTVYSAGMLFSLYDDSDEEDIPIASEWDGSNPVQLNWDVVDYKGFRFAHSAGARAGTNLFTEVPNDIDAMLTGFSPLVYIVCLDEKDVLVAGHQIEPNFSMHIEYRRALVEPSPSGHNNGLNTNLWGMRSQRMCRYDFERIAQTIRNNTTLTTHKGENCIALGDPLNPQKERFSKTWNKIVVDANTQHFAAMGEFSVRGFREVFYGDAYGAA